MSLLEKLKAFSQPAADREAFRQRVSGAVSATDWARIEGAEQLLSEALEALEQHQQNAAKLRSVLFGSKSEKAAKVCPPPDPPPSDAKPKRKGHGRRPARQYTGARRIPVCHPSVKVGDLCPKCQRGKVRAKKPAVVVQVEASPPITAKAFEMERFRCDTCGTVFTAPTPPEAMKEKYAPSVGVTVACFRYGAGFPHYRLARWQESLGVPLPESTQWELMLPVAKAAEPIIKELARQGAQTPLVHHDDTSMRIQELRKAGSASAAEIDPKRKGTFTTAMIVQIGKCTVTLFRTGWKHGGENLTDLLSQREPGRGPPIQMCDALAANFTVEYQTILANCMTHGRRGIVDVHESFPVECRHILTQLGKLYRVDAEAKEQKMTDEQRLLHHQTHSGPVVVELERWMKEELAQKRVEPNSGLGKAIAYLQGHWEALTLFLRVAGAPLDNNIAERTLKMAIVHRKNSLGYKTVMGAKVGDLIMSLIQTCRVNGNNPFNYMLALVNNAEAVAANPGAWLPWNYPQDPQASAP